jgi:predicted nuclease of predicted toxin-antitoxin system
LRFLLEENFPLQLYRQVKARGIDCEHIVAMGHQQMTDLQILERVNSEADLVLLTQDREFETMPIRFGKVIISRLPQSLPTQRRVEVWLQ